MTTATIGLAELAEKKADIDVLRQMMQFMAQRLISEAVLSGRRIGEGQPRLGPPRTLSQPGTSTQAKLSQLPARLLREPSQLL